MRWRAAIGALSAVAILVTGFGALAVDGTDGEKVLLTDTQRAAIMGQVDDYREQGLGRDQIMTLVRDVMDEYVSQNLEDYGLIDEEIAEMMSTISEISEQRSDIRGLLRELRTEGATSLEIHREIAPLRKHLRTLQDQLGDILAKYGIEIPSFIDMTGRDPPTTRHFAL